VLLFAGGEVIKHADFFATCYKFFNDVGTNESGAAGHQIRRRFNSFRRLEVWSSTSVTS
jgi:hypothetical protein